MKRILLGLLLALALWREAPAQQPVVTSQSWAGTINASGTITATGVFQSVFSATAAGSAPRQSCTVQNNGTHTMYVFFGPVASATTSNTVQLSAGQAVACYVGGATLQDQVSITGTISEAFYAARQ